MDRFPSNIKKSNCNAVLKHKGFSQVWWQNFTELSSNSKVPSKLKGFLDPFSSSFWFSCLSCQSLLLSTCFQPKKNKPWSTLADQHQRTKNVSDYLVYIVEHLAAKKADIFLHVMLQPIGETWCSMKNETSLFSAPKNHREISTLKVFITPNFLGHLSFRVG